MKTFSAVRKLPVYSAGKGNGILNIQEVYMKADLAKIIECLEDASDDITFFYHVPTETVAHRNSDGLWLEGQSRPADPDDYLEELIELPSRYDINEYGIMRDFAEEETKGTAQEWLLNSLHGKGAFRRFRAALDRFGLRENWYDYKDSALRSIAMVWCEDNGIEYYETKEYVDPEDEEDPYFDEEEDVQYIKVQANEPMHIVQINEKNMQNILYMTAAFRKTLASFHQQTVSEDLEQAEEEIAYYLKREYPVFAVSKDGRFVGYAVCRIDDSCVWLESIYVRDEYRRKGVGKMLFRHAEKIAEEYGNDTLYNYVHPNNDRMLRFLAKMGYDVLNLIEVRKAGKNENTPAAYTIGNNTFKY